MLYRSPVAALYINRFQKEKCSPRLFKIQPSSTAIHELSASQLFWRVFRNRLSVCRQRIGSLPSESDIVFICIFPSVVTCVITVAVTPILLLSQRRWISMGALHREIDLVRHIDNSRQISQIHYGGGSPTSIPIPMLKELNDHLLSIAPTIAKSPRLRLSAILAICPSTTGNSSPHADLPAIALVFGI